jgi:hypothetical protein
LFVFFFVVSVTGLLLGWKKHTGGLILAKTHAGVSTDQKNWLPVHVLHEKAVDAASTQVSPKISSEVERIDIRPDKGIAKFIFAGNYWGVQLDMTTGEVLHFERRDSDFIENLHDGSYFDKFFGTNYEQIKLVYTSVIGLALLMFTITGFWLWYGPKQFRASHRQAQAEE